MTKAELVKDVATRLQNITFKIDQKGTKIFIDVFLKALEDSLLRGEEVRFPDFGTFKIKTQKARKGVIPKTGKKIDIPEKKVVTFKSSKALKEKMAK